MMYQVFVRQNQTQAARRELELAICTTPNDPEPYLTLGDIALKERRVFEATKDFETAKQLLEKYTNAACKTTMDRQVLNGFAGVAESHEEWKEAESLLRNLLKLAPRDLDAHELLAHALFWQGKAAEAYDILKTTKTIDRESAEKNKTKEAFPAPETIMAQYCNRYDDAKSETSNAAKWIGDGKKLPNDLSTRQVIAFWALKNGNLALAKEQVEAVLKSEAADASLNPKDRKYRDSHVGHVLHGSVALWERQWAEAERDFTWLVLKNPTDFVAKSDLVLALVEQDAPAKKWQAKVILEEILKDDRSFSIRPEALKLYEKVKDAKRPEERSDWRVTLNRTTSRAFQMHDLPMTANPAYPLSRCTNASRRARLTVTRSRNSPRMTETQPIRIARKYVRDHCVGRGGMVGEAFRVARLALRRHRWNQAAARSRCRRHLDGHDNRRAPHGLGIAMP